MFRAWFRVSRYQEKISTNLIDLWSYSKFQSFFELHDLSYLKNKQFSEEHFNLSNKLFTKQEHKK